MPGPPSGARLGKAIADIVGDVVHKANMAGHPKAIEARHTFTTQAMERMETEMRPAVTRVLGWVLESDETPDHLRALVEAATGPEHQTDLLLQIVAMVGVAFGGFTQLAGPMMQKMMNQLWVDHPDVPLTPDQAASAVIRGVNTDLDLEYEAKRSGVAHTQFAVLEQLAGEPPGPMDLVAMWRRGIIDQGRLDHGIRQSRVRDEWVDVYHALRHVPLGVAEVVQAAVQGHMSYNDAKQIADGLGVDPAGFDVLYQTAGNPPGPETALEWLNRGIIDQPTATQALRESRLKDKYIGPILESRWRLPPERTVVSMVRKGVLTPADGVAHLLRLGFAQGDAAALISEATTDKVATEKDLAKSEITQLYAAGVITRDQAVRFLGDLHYSPEEASFILGLVDTALRRAQIQSAITKVRSLYVAYRIDRPEVSTQLDALGVQPSKRDDMLHVWDLERDANQRDLTLTDLRQMVRAGIIDPPTFGARVEQLGYSSKDANLLVDLEASRNQ